LRVLESKALRRTFEHEGEEVNRGWKNYIMRSCMTYFSPNIIKVISQGVLDGRGLWHLWRRRDMHRVLVGNLKKRSHLKVLSIKAIIILKRSSKNRMRVLGLDWSG
jgi:hypothetical protein